MTTEHRLSDERIHLAIEELVATITINRPEKLNAIDPAMLESLREAFQIADRSGDVRVVILASAGERAFCVGADINAWAELEPLDMWRRWVRDGHAALDAIASVRQPVIAAVKGLALGGGLELALACDLRIASETAQFGSPEVKIGTLPGWGGTRRLANTIGVARAKYLMFTGELIDAATADSWGLINERTDPSEVLERAHEIAATIADNAPTAVQLSKAVIDSRGTGSTLEAIAGALAATTEDATEGIASFREKRTAEFRDK
jgi:enoyl-CoA hydratase/carnithine racemase